MSHGSQRIGGVPGEMKTNVLESDWQPVSMDMWPDARLLLASL
jgi:hypothetical protein